MLKNNSFPRYHLPTLIWGIIIFVVSSIPSDKIPNIQIFGIDKLVHIFAFFIFGFLIYRSIYFSIGNKLSFTKIAIYVILIIVIVGVLDELYQGLIPGRSTDIYDLVADVIGGVLSIFFAKRYIRIHSEELIL